LNFGTLKNRVIGFLDRDDTNIDTLAGEWINDIRQELALEYLFPWLYKEATLTTEAGSSDYAYPADYIGHMSVFVRDTNESRGGRMLSKREGTLHDQFTQVDVDPENNTYYTPGKPIYYIERGGWIELVPPPDDNGGSNYTLEIRYYAYPTSFSTSGEYDRMSNLHYNAIIYGAVLRGAIYFDDNDKIKSFLPKYETAIRKMVMNEKLQEMRDTHPRMKTWKDYPNLVIFKRRFNLGNQ